MSEIGSKPDHLPGWVFAGAIPVQQHTHRERMAEVMNAWTSSMPVKLLSRAQSDRLADDCEVVPGAAIAEALTEIRYKERFRSRPEKPVALSDGVNEP